MSHQVWICGESNGVIDIDSTKRTVEKIQRLKKERNAIVLAHNYQLPEVQDVGDFLGDSLDLSMRASRTDAKVIIFCGVDFMAESAKILSPEKTVVIPSREAICPMAAMINPDELHEMKREHPGAGVVAYVNTTAEIKAEVDICCTSANAVRVVRSLPNREVIFIPDVNLGLYVQRSVPEKRLIFCSGYCRVHRDITVKDLAELKGRNPGAEVLVHPESSPDVIDFADHVYSTQGMVNHVKDSDASDFIIGTEREMCYRLEKENPEKTFHPVPHAICTAMKRITLENVLESLESLEPRVELSDELISRAKAPLTRMLEVGRGG